MALVFIFHLKITDKTIGYLNKIMFETSCILLVVLSPVVDFMTVYLIYVNRWIPRLPWVCPEY